MYARNRSSTHVEDPRDVRTAKSGSDACFLDETLRRLGVRGGFRQEDLENDGFVEQHVPRRDDDRNWSGVQRPFDAVLLADDVA